MPAAGSTEDTPALEGVEPLTAGVVTVLRPGWALATMAANTPAAAIPATATQRVTREI